MPRPYRAARASLALTALAGLLGTTLLASPAHAATTAAPAPTGTLSFVEGPLFGASTYTSRLDGSLARESVESGAYPYGLSTDGLRRVGVRQNPDGSKTIVTSASNGSTPIEGRVFASGSDTPVALQFSPDDTKVIGLIPLSSGGTQLFSQDVATGAVQTAPKLLPALDIYRFSVLSDGTIVVPSSHSVTVYNSDGSVNHVAQTAAANTFFTDAVPSADGMYLFASLVSNVTGAQPFSIQQTLLLGGPALGTVALTREPVELATDPAGKGVFVNEYFKDVAYAVPGQSPVPVHLALAGHPVRSLMVGAADVAPAAATTLPAPNVSAVSDPAGSFTLQFAAPADPSTRSFVVRELGTDGVAPYSVFSGSLAAELPSTQSSFASGPQAPGHHRFAVFALDSARNASEATLVDAYALAPAQLTISAPAQTPIYTTPRVTGRILDAYGNPVAGATVELWARPYGQAYARQGIVTSTADASGPNLSLFVSPIALTDYQWRFVGGNAAGENSYLTDAQSGETRMRVSPRLTGQLSTARIALGHTARFAGALTPVLPGRTVYLQRYQSGAWHSVARTVTTGSASYTFSLRPSARGRFSYRAYAPATVDYLSALSPARVLTVG